METLAEIHGALTLALDASERPHSYTHARALQDHSRRGRGRHGRCAMVAKRYLWKHPSGRIYVRLKGTLHRITAAEGTADFDRQYWEILTGKRMQAKTSWSALMDDYRKSDRWTGLKPRTRQDYDKVMGSAAGT
ncbi:hypothetical protein E3D03_018685 [Paracoccus sp. DMF]|nr:hypothetical protein [Paracoccus sp. DMF]